MGAFDALAHAETHYISIYSWGFTYMSRAVHLRRVDSDEIDVFEATQYFSGGFIVHDDLFLRKDTREARAHSRAVGRRSLDTLNKTRLVDKNYGKDKKQQQQQQQQCPGGKLANFLTSLFRQTLVVLYKKRSLKTDRNLQVLEVQPERGSSRSISCYVSAERSEEGYWKNKASDNYQKPPASDHQGAVVIHGVKYDEKEASSLMSTRELMARGDHKEEYLVMVKELEEDGEGSESSSDLFELESCHLQGDFSFDLPVYGSPNLHAWCLQST